MSALRLVWSKAPHLSLVDHPDAAREERARRTARLIGRIVAPRVQAWMVRREAQRALLQDVDAPERA